MIWVPKVHFLASLLNYNEIIYVTIKCPIRVCKGGHIVIEMLYNCPEK